MVIHSEDARRSRTEHFDNRSLPQPHFFEAVDEIVAAVEVMD